MIPQKLDIIRRLESGAGQREGMASYREGPIMTVYCMK